MELRCWMDEEELEEDGLALVDEEEAQAMCTRCKLVGDKHTFSLLQLVAKRPLCLECEARSVAASPAARARARVAELMATQSRIAEKNRKAMNKFREVRRGFLRSHAAELLASPLKITGLAPAPMLGEGVVPFMSLLPEQSSALSLRMVFHGTEEKNLLSIFRRGLIIGGTNGVPVANGTAHGHGIYTGATASMSAGYCRRSSKMLVCALLEKHGPVDCYGDMVVVRTQGRVIPMFVLEFCHGDLKTGNPDSLLDGCFV